MVRNDDNLIFTCETEDGRKATTSTASTLVQNSRKCRFFRFRIVDAITDKHREYPQVS